MGSLGAVLASLVVGPPDVVTWAPTSAARRRRRGFDQARLLAAATARALDRPCRPLLRRTDGAAQTGRSATERWSGPAFTARPVAGLRVLVVDDVATTGATLAAAARALDAAGAREVHGAALAVTPRRSRHGPESGSGGSGEGDVPRAAEQCVVPMAPGSRCSQRLPTLFSTSA